MEDNPLPSSRDDAFSDLNGTFSGSFICWKMIAKNGKGEPFTRQGDQIELIPFALCQAS
jgi:hypothetical protein